MLARDVGVPSDVVTEEAVMLIAGGWSTVYVSVNVEEAEY